MKSDVVTLTIDMRFAPDKIGPAIKLLTFGKQRIEAKPGCGECLVARDSTEENRVRYTEKWASEGALKRHLQSEEFQRLLIAMDMCSAEPDVAVGSFSGHTGIVYLQQLCDRPDAGESEPHNPVKEIKA